MTAASIPAALMLLAGCATYADNMQAVDRALVAGRPAAALAALKPLAEGRSRLLYLLDKAMILRVQRRYSASIKAFRQAKPLLRYLEKTSISETAAALTLSENLRSYAPPLPGRLLLHVYQSLNYIQVGNREAARVEMRQVDVLLGRLYPESHATPEGSEAFARYFAGLLYQDAGQWDEARIAWRKAYKAYRRAGQPVPGSLETSLCRAAQRLGLENEWAGYHKRFGASACPTESPASGAAGGIVFILSDGLAPEKVAFTRAIRDPTSGNFYSLSLPTLRRRASPVRRASVSVGGKTRTAEMVYSVSHWARVVLEDNMPGLIAAQLARNVTRAAVANQANRQKRGLGIVVSLFGALVDRADTRSWSVLPDGIRLAYVRVPAGRYDMKVAVAGRVTATRVFENIVVKPGRLAFVTWHVIGR